MEGDVSVMDPWGPECLLLALGEGKGRLAYQPVVCAVSYETVCYECLLRLSMGGRIFSAWWYIEAAERYCAIWQVDATVLGMVVQELRAYPNIKLSVNISNMSVVDPEWLTRAQKLLGKPDIANRLTIEITETGSCQNFAKIADSIMALKVLGCSIAVDDFGTGIFAIDTIDSGQLASLNIDIIKIDGIYITNILENTESKIFLTKVVEFAKQHNIKTVAEFVENRSVTHFLKLMGIDYMQGHYFSRALNYRQWKHESG